MRHVSTLRFLLVLAAVGAAAASCSVVNTADDPLPPGGGAGGATTSTTNSGGHAAAGGGTGATTTSSSTGGQGATGTGGTGGDGGAIGGAGGASQCTTPEQCPLPSTVCLQRTCTAGQCGTEPAAGETSCEDELYCSSGDTCANGACQAGPDATCTSNDPCVAAGCDEAARDCTDTPIVACGPAEGCCAPGCTSTNDADCIYWVSGVQQNVPEASLVGWTLCHSSTYLDYSPLPQLLQDCDGGRLLLACRPVGNGPFTLLAMADRADVLWDCADSETCVHQANGAGWYYSAEYSWGFAPANEPVYRSSCDYNDGSQTLPGLRMCWHTGGNSVADGYRCGDNDLNGASNWQRVVYTAP